jgi:trans-2,3-dihydro-3-hydroxyanthranilate isomerase
VVVSIEQGAEIGRPSVIQVFVEHEAGRVHDVRVGGQCQLVGEGTLLAPKIP